MTFTIKFHQGHETYDDSHTADFKDSGILEVKKGGDPVAAYSPSHWIWVKPGELPPRTPAKVHKLR